VSVDPDTWAAPVVLADGESAFVRPMTPADAPLLLAFHERQPRENLYRRFFSPKPTLTANELRHFTEVDFRDRVALVLEQRGEFIAWASYERWSGRDDADVAFMVDADHQGKGIATLLLEHLAAIARSNGVTRFTADVLSDNRAMLRVFSRAGWPVTRHYDSGVTELEFPLSDTEHFLDSVESREHRADSRAVARLLLPRSVAVIGASDRPGTIGDELWRNVSSTFSGPVFPVNARRATVAGRRAYASVEDIDEDVWLAVIAVPAGALATTIDQCIAKRVRGAVVITAVDGAGVDVDAIVEHARRNGLRLIGPASMGIASPATAAGSGLQAALVPVTLPPGGVAISMQSGSLGASLLQQAWRLQMGISWFVSLGDKGDISGNDLVQFWEDDDATRVIAIYTESWGNPRKFARIARRVGRRKPVVAVRTGTAAIGAAGDALYQQAGLIEVPTVRALLDTARVLATQPVPRGPRVAVLTNSRSPGVLATAAVEAAGLVAVEPPLPLDWRATADDFAAAVRAAVGSDAVDAVLVVHAPPLASAPAPVDEVDAAAAGARVPVVAVMLGREDGPVKEGSAVPSFSFPEPAAAVLGRMHSYSRWLSTEADAAVEPLDGIDVARADELLRAAVGGSGGRLTRLDLPATRELLATYGLQMPHAALTVGASADEIVGVADAIGYPVALKATHRRAGRSARAGIALDLTHDHDVREALEVIRESLGEDATAIVVQQMIAPGVDVHICCTTDRWLGPVVSVGLGSLQAETLGDNPSRLAPVSRAGATRLVERSLVGAAMAAARLDPTVLVEAIMRVSRLVFEHPQIVSVDVNPAIVSASGCQFTDAKIDVEDHERTEPALRRLV